MASNNQNISTSTGTTFPVGASLSGTTTTEAIPSVWFGSAGWKPAPVPTSTTAEDNNNNNNNNNGDEEAAADAVLDVGAQVVQLVAAVAAVAETNQKRKELGWNMFNSEIKCTATPRADWSGFKIEIDVGKDGKTQVEELFRHECGPPCHQVEQEHGHREDRAQDCAYNKVYESKQAHGVKIRAHALKVQAHESKVLERTQLHELKLLEMKFEHELKLQTLATSNTVLTVGAGQD